MRPPRPPDRSADAPWKQRFHASLFGDLQIAAGDRRSAVVSSNDSGVFQTYALNLTDGAMRQLTQAEAGTVLAHLTADGRSLLTLDDAGGNEVGHWVSLPVGGGDPTDLTPEMPAYSSWSVATDRAGHVAIAITSDDGTEVWLASLADASPPRRFAAMWGLVLEIVFSSDGRTLYCLSSEPTRSNAYAALAFDTATGDRLGELWDGPPSSMHGLVAEPSGDRIATSSDLSGRARPLVWSARDATRVDLPLDLPGDVDVLDWSDDGRELLLAATDRAGETLVRYDLASSATHAVDLGGGSFGPDARFGPDGDVIVVRSSTKDAPEIVAVGPGDVRAIARPHAPPGTALRSVSFPSSDGTLIQAWVGQPEGLGPFPTVLSVHGGPEAASTDAYGPRLASWTDHGYAVCALNYRGSTTFGREYQQAIWNNIGHWEVEDLAATAAWLVDEGIAEPRGIVLTGGSYGGFLTLLGLGRLPDLWAGGVAHVAIGDWVRMYDEAADSLRAYQEQMFGGPPDEHPERYRIASPITYVQDVTAPVLVFQGSNDSRCPPGQFRAYEDAARAAGKSIEVEWFEAGHIGPSMDQIVEQQERALAFVHGLFAGVAAS